MPQNLLEIIKIAKKFGLKKLKCGDIELEFGEEMPKAAPRGRHVSKEISEEDEKKIKEEQLANMLIEDPLQYEEMIMKDN